jgi:hypothetical protein
VFAGGRISPVKNYFPGCWDVKQVNEADECRLTAAAWANNGKDLPFLYIQVYRIQNVSIADLARKTGYLD